MCLSVCRILQFNSLFLSLLWFCGLLNYVYINIVLDTSICFCVSLFCLHQKFVSTTLVGSPSFFAHSSSWSRLVSSLALALKAATADDRHHCVASLVRHRWRPLYSVAAAVAAGRLQPTICTIVVVAGAPAGG